MCAKCDKFWKYLLIQNLTFHFQKTAMSANYILDQWDARHMAAHPAVLCFDEVRHFIHLMSHRLNLGLHLIA
jgi:hypothetical protein